MAKAAVSITLLVMILVMPSESAAVKPFLATLAVFEPGKFPTESFVANESNSDSPKPLFIISPTIEGNYPVLLFFHGTCVVNSAYSHLFKHIASHGYIVVAPQMYTCPFIIPTISQNKELKYAAQVANWLVSGLQTVLPKNVQGNIDQLAVSGHSTGGKIAFALALGYSQIPLEVVISLLVGVDPVAGFSTECRCDPKILTFVHNSFNLNIPVTIIGSHLGEKKSPFYPPCAPKGVNHKQFYFETKPPVGYFVAKQYGHNDILDDNKPVMNICLGKASRDPMRRTVGGIIVAFLNGYFRYETKDYLTIVHDHSVAPVYLHPRRFMNETKEALEHLKFEFCPFDMIPDCHSKTAYM